LLKVFCFLGFYFMGLGWLVVCLDVVLCFYRQLALQWVEFYKELGFNSPTSYFSFFGFLFAHEPTCSTC
jgi:hypothetical protein